MSYDTLLVKMGWTPQRARSQVIANADLVIATKGLEWPNDILLDTWKANMANDGVFVDQKFIQICAEMLNRTFIFVTVHKEAGDSGTGKIIITPQTSIGGPLYFLYFTENRFYSPHYQSIRPLVEDSSVIQRRQLRLASVPDQSADFNPNFDSSKVSTRSKTTDVSVSQFSREKSYIDTSNIVQGKRKRKRNK